MNLEPPFLNAFLQALQSIANNIRGSNILSAIDINGTTYQKLYFKSGTVSLSVTASDSDYGSVDLGIAKFPNGVLFSSAEIAGAGTSWTNLRMSGTGLGATQGASNLVWQNFHVNSGSAQTITIRWFAIGY